MIEKALAEPDPLARARRFDELGELSGFAEGVAHGYRAAGGLLPEDWRRRTLYEGLIDWAAFLGRPQIGDALADDARRMIARTRCGTRNL